MIALDIEALAAIGYSADQNGLVRPIVVACIGLGSFGGQVVTQRDQVEHCGRELRDGPAFLPGHVADHRERLEVDLRAHHGRAVVEVHAALQLRHGVREHEEVVVGRPPERLRVAVRVLVDDVLPDADVNGHWDAEAISRRADAHIPMGQLLALDIAPESLAQADIVTGSLSHHVVDLAGLGPHTEPAGLDIRGNALACRADQR